MENKQIVTNDDTRLNCYEALDELDQIYVDMRVEGYLCSHISKKAKVKHGTVRNWFMTGGRLHEAYKLRLVAHRKEMRKAFKEIDKIIKDGAVHAALKELEAVKASGTWPGTMMAAKDLLSRAGFDAPEKIDALLTHKTDSAVVEAARKLLEDDADDNTQT